MTQQPALRLPHISGSSHYAEVDLYNCAGVVCCFGWRLSAAPDRPDHCVETVNLHYRTNIVLLILWGRMIKKWVLCYREKQRNLSHDMIVQLHLSCEKGFYINNFKARINDMMTFIVQCAVVGIYCCSSIVSPHLHKQCGKIRWNEAWNEVWASGKTVPVSMPGCNRRRPKTLTKTLMALQLPISPQWIIYSITGV